MNEQPRKIKIKKEYLITFFLILLIIGIILIKQSLTNNSSQTNTRPLLESSTNSSDEKVEVNRSLQFNAPPDKTGIKSDKKITFTITTVEKKNSIRVNEKSKASSAGKDFLLVRLEIDNPTTQRIRFISSDFVRLVQETNKRFAPDYHNGTVTLDPISIRRDLIAFTINQADKKFIFLVGELDKEKEQIEVEFK